MYIFFNVYIILNFLEIRSLISFVVQFSFCLRSCSNSFFCCLESLEGLPPAYWDIIPSYPLSFHLSCQIYPIRFVMPNFSAAFPTLSPSYRNFIKYIRFKFLDLFLHFYPTIRFFNAHSYIDLDFF